MAADVSREHERPVLDQEGIKRILPQREPFLMIDAVIEHEPGVRVVGVKSVTAHDCGPTSIFPGEHAVMSPTLILEAIAQTGAVLQLSLPENKGKNAYLAGLDDVRIGRPVRPGDQLVCEAATIKQKGNIGRMSGRASVNGEVCVEGTYMFALTPMDGGERRNAG